MATAVRYNNNGEGPPLRSRAGPAVSVSVPFSIGNLVMGGLL